MVARWAQLATLELGARNLHSIPCHPPALLPNLLAEDRKKDASEVHLARDAGPLVPASSRPPAPHNALKWRLCPFTTCIIPSPYGSRVCAQLSVQAAPLAVAGVDDEGDSRLRPNENTKITEHPFSVTFPCFQQVKPCRFPQPRTGPGEVLRSHPLPQQQRSLNPSTVLLFSLPGIMSICVGTGKTNNRFTFLFSLPYLMRTHPLRPPLHSRRHFGCPRCHCYSVRLLHRSLRPSSSRV